MNKLINNVRSAMSKRVRLTYSSLSILLILIAAIAIPTTNNLSVSPSAKLVIAKNPLVSGNTNSKPTASASPVTVKTTGAAASNHSTSVSVVTPPVTVQTPVKSTATSTTTPVTTVTTTTVTAPVVTPVQTPVVTPLSVLTSLITNLENGQSANITASSVVIPGPISNATGQPIVFSANGQTYFAYTQGQAPDFNTTPAQTAASMAIVEEPTTDSGITLSQAHLDKTNLLVDENEMGVGYSTGGN